MRKFFSGLIMASDDKASMAKVMAWLTYIAFIVSWFVLPDRNNADIIAVFSLLLGYTLTGKWTHYKHGQRGGGNDRQD